MADEPFRLGDLTMPMWGWVVSGLMFVGTAVGGFWTWELWIITGLIALEVLVYGLTRLAPDTDDEVITAAPEPVVTESGGDAWEAMSSDFDDDENAVPELAVPDFREHVDEAALAGGDDDMDGWGSLEEEERRLPPGEEVHNGPTDDDGEPPARPSGPARRILDPSVLEEQHADEDAEAVAVDLAPAPDPAERMLEKVRDRVRGEED